MLPTLQTLLGDCRKTLRKLPERSIQCCVTSPPYFGLRSYLPADHPDKHREIGHEKTPAAFVATMVKVFTLVHRAMKDDGTLWLNLGDTYSTNAGGYYDDGGSRGSTSKISKKARSAATQHRSRTLTPGLKHKDLMGIPWMVAFALREAGWYLRQEIIWHKPNPMPESIKDRCTKAHEHIFLLTKSERYYFDQEAVREPFQTDEKENYPARAKVTGRGEQGYAAARGDDRDKSGGFPPCGDGRNKRSVWTIATESFKGSHFATFPSDLVRPCILAGSRPGDLVLDPFGGSGTVGQVALELGRSAVLCELNPEYIPLIQRRTNVTPGLGL